MINRVNLTESNSRGSQQNIQEFDCWLQVVFLQGIRKDKLDRK